MRQVNVDFISEENKGNGANAAVVAVVEEFLEPWLRLHESILLRLVEHQSNSVHSSVVHAVDTAKTFLASGVPNVQDYLLLADLSHILLHEVHPDSRLRCLCESILDISINDASFADSRISQQYNLKRNLFPFENYSSIRGILYLRRREEWWRQS